MVEYAKRASMKNFSTGFATDGGSHWFGYATCHWIKHCNRANGDQVGTPCSDTLSGVKYEGFCFTSDEDTLECGHLTALDNEYGEKPVAFDKAIPAGWGQTATSAGLVPTTTAPSGRRCPSC